MTYKVTGSIKENKTFVAHMNGRQYIMDQNVEGHDAIETSPGGFLALALAGCKAMSAMSYFESRGKEAVVTVHLEAEYPKDTQGISQFMQSKVVMEFEGADLTEKDLRVVQRVVDKACTIQQVIDSSENVVNTEYVLKTTDNE